MNEEVPVANCQKPVKYYAGDAHDLPVYIVPQDFYLPLYIVKYQERFTKICNQNTSNKDAAADLANLLFEFYPNEPADIQRSYNGMKSQGGDGFVSDFTPAASFVYAIACYLCGLTLKDALDGGGAANYSSSLESDSVDISGDQRNNPHNAKNIDIGYKFCTINKIPPPQVPKHINLKVVIVFAKEKVLIKVAKSKIGLR